MLATPDAQRQTRRALPRRGPARAKTSTLRRTAPNKQWKTRTSSSSSRPRASAASRAIRLVDANDLLRPRTSSRRRRPRHPRPRHPYRRRRPRRRRRRSRRLLLDPPLGVERNRRVAPRDPSISRASPPSETKRRRTETPKVDADKRGLRHRAGLCQRRKEASRPQRGRRRPRARIHVTQGNGASFDEKNIGYVYDALNVLMAMGISKEKKK